MPAHNPRSLFKLHFDRWHSFLLSTLPTSVGCATHLPLCRSTRPRVVWFSFLETYRCINVVYLDCLQQKYQIFGSVSYDKTKVYPQSHVLNFQPQGEPKYCTVVELLALSLGSCSMPARADSVLTVPRLAEC